MANQPQPPSPPKPPAPKPEDDAAALPKDFKLPEAGSRDYVAGQPVDDAELQKTQDAERKRIEEGRKAAEDAQRASKK